MTDTKELVERVQADRSRDRSQMTRGDMSLAMDAAYAALFELEERLEAAEKALDTPRQYDTLVSHWKARAQAAERERDEWKAAALAEDERRTQADRRVAELEEALREIEKLDGESLDDIDFALDRAGEIARAALDRVKVESSFPRPKMVEIGEERE